MFCFRAVASGNGVIKRDKTKIKAPIKNPEKIICLGMNYADHCFEQNKPIPERPLLFFKLPNSIIGQGDDIVCPDIVEVRTVFRNKLLWNMFVCDSNSFTKNRSAAAFMKTFLK